MHGQIKHQLLKHSKKIFSGSVQHTLPFFLAGRRLGLRYQLAGKKKHNPPVGILGDNPSQELDEDSDSSNRGEYNSLNVSFFAGIFWVVPPPSKSHHQEYYIFRLGNPNLNLHFHYYCEGGQPKVYLCVVMVDQSAGTVG